MYVAALCASTTCPNFIIIIINLNKLTMATLKKQAEALSGYIPAPLTDGVELTEEMAQATLGTTKLITHATKGQLVLYLGARAFDNDNGGKTYYTYWMDAERKRYSISLGDLMNKCRVNGKNLVEAMGSNSDGIVNLVVGSTRFAVKDVKPAEDQVYPLSAYKGYSQSSWKAYRKLFPNQTNAEIKESYIRDKSLRENALPFLGGIEFTLYTS
jgi:hypothetical protein